MLLVWLLAAVVLLVAEVATTAVFAIFLTIGAAAAAAAVVAGADVPVQVIVFAAVSIGGVVLGRPPLRRRVGRRNPMAPLPGVGELVGQHAIAADTVGDEHHPGHVVLAGERWLAVTDGPIALVEGIHVVVVAVKGTTLVVRGEPTAASAGT